VEVQTPETHRRPPAAGRKGKVFAGAAPIAARVGLCGPMSSKRRSLHAVSATRICFPRVPSSRSPQLITSLHVRQLNSGLSNRPQHCTIATMQSLKQLLPGLLLPAMVLACLPIAAHAGPADCELNKVALARVVAQDARLHFIAGASKP